MKDHKMRRLLPSGRAVSVSFENHGALGLTFKENAGVYRLEISQYLSTNQGPKDLQPGALRFNDQDCCACPPSRACLPANIFQSYINPKHFGSFSHGLSTTLSSKKPG